MKTKALFGRKDLDIQKCASAGTMESSDVYVEIEPAKNGIEFSLESVVKEQFGDKAEPLYERLSTYIKILHDNKFVVYMNKIKKK